MRDRAGRTSPRRSLGRHRLAGDDGGGGRGAASRGARVAVTRYDDRRRGADHARRARSRRRRAAARAPAPGRLVGGRARVERDDDRRAPLLAPRARPARPRAPTASSPTTSSRGVATTAPGRTGGRARRPLDDDRVVRRPEDGRRRPRPEDARVHPAGGRHPAEPRVHEVLHGAARPLAVAADPADPAGADPAPAVRAVLDLQLRLLGPPDGRPAVGRVGAPPGAAGRRRSERDRRAPGRDEAARRVRRLRRRASRRRRLGEGPPGGGRLVGRHPAAVGLVDRDAGRARPRLRGRHAAPRGRGLGRFHRRGRRPPPPRGLPVAGLGHGAGRDRPPRRRRSTPTTRSSARPASGSSPKR